MPQHVQGRLLQSEQLETALRTKARRAEVEARREEEKKRVRGTKRLISYPINKQIVNNPYQKKQTLKIKRMISLLPTYGDFIISIE